MQPRKSYLVSHHTTEKGIRQLQDFGSPLWLMISHQTLKICSDFRLRCDPNFRMRNVYIMS